MSSDRIKFQVASQSKFWSVLGCLRQPGQLLSQLQKSMREISSQLIKFCATRPDSYRDVPAAETKSIGLPADSAFGEGRRAGASFFARHLDYFIVTQNSHPSPGLGTVKIIYRDPRLIVLPGLAKNAAPRPFAIALGRLRRQLIKPPGRWQ